jgi:para-nitrobenzyl esterase
MLEGRRAWGLVVIVASAVAGCSSSSSPQQGGAGADGSSPGPTLIQTDHGPVQGAASDTARQFTGIPFAAPPVGSFRWKAPADHPHWTAPLDATHLGAACMGLALTSGGGLQGGGSEDCLTLNVWAPLQQTAHAPVLVWIYGGGFVTGSAADPTYNG